MYVIFEFATLKLSFFLIIMTSAIVLAIDRLMCLHRTATEITKLQFGCAQSHFNGQTIRNKKKLEFK